MSLGKIFRGSQLKRQMDGRWEVGKMRRCEMNEYGKLGSCEVLRQKSEKLSGRWSALAEKIKSVRDLEVYKGKES